MDKAFALLVVPAKAGDGFFFEAKWRHDGVQVKRRVGAAWVKRRPAPLPDTEGWQRHYAARTGRREDGALTAREAERRVQAMIAEHAADHAAKAKHGRIVTFADAAAEFLSSAAGRTTGRRRPVAIIARSWRRRTSPAGPAGRRRGLGS